MLGNATYLILSTKHRFWMANSSEKSPCQGTRWYFSWSFSWLSSWATCDHLLRYPLQNYQLAPETELEDDLFPFEIASMGKCYVRFRECMDIVGYTPPKTSISPEKCWLEGFSIWNGSFSGDMLIVRGQSWLSHQYFQFRFGSNSHLSWHIDMILTKNYPKGNRPFNTNIILIRPPLAPLEFRTYMWNLPIDPLATAFIRLGRSEWLIYFARSRKCNRNMSRQRGRRSKKPWKSLVGSNEVSFSDGLCSEAMLVSGSVSSG